MSNLYKSAMQARLAKLPHPNQLPAIPSSSSSSHNAEDDVDEDEESHDALGALPPGGGIGPPAMQVHIHALYASDMTLTNCPLSSVDQPLKASLTPRQIRSKPKHIPNPDFSPISAAGFFAEALQVSVPSRNLDFRAYHTPPTLTNAERRKGDTGTVMVCHHGAGYSGLSFACFAREVRELSRGECGVLAFDARRHGKTTSTDGHDEDLSVGVLVEDFIGLMRTMFPDPTTAPSFLFVGHSMGGSVVVQASPTLQEQFKYRVSGVAVLDVVEGSAIEALPHMHSLLNARPDGFESIEEAVEWHVTAHTIRNARSARVSIPAIFKHEPNAEILPPYQWRTPLRSTAPYWMSWFQGLSSKFLSTRAARILILAGTDRLDKELMIGQMQGKFQQVVVPGVGHMLHEDDPTRLAEILVEFWKRNERVVVGIKKVGDR